jgi:hypothetical protein
MNFIKNISKHVFSPLALPLVVPITLALGYAYVSAKRGIESVSNEHMAVLLRQQGKYPYINIKREQSK